MSPPVDVIALDVGNSKTDVVLVCGDGALLGAVTGATASHQAVGFERAMAVVERLTVAALEGAGGSAGVRPFGRILVDCTAGADFAYEDRRIRRALLGLGLADEVIVRNDTFAPLRAGTSRPYGVAVICGYGINCAGLGGDGRMFRFPGLGEISGDWGGGSGLGTEALIAAVRGRDGRGPRTMLEETVPAHFGKRNPLGVTQALYGGRIEHGRLFELAPLVFEAAMAGDDVARSLVDRLADEIVAMASVALRRCRLVRAEVDVVLGGGVFRTEDDAFHARIARGISTAAPRARTVRLTAPPVIGSALLGLDALGRTTATAEERLRGELTREALVRVAV